MSFNKCVLGILAASGMATSSLADDIGDVKIFGQWYKAQRFDVSEQVVWPDPINIGFDVPMNGSEGIAFRSNSEIFMSTSDGGSFGTAENWVVKAALDFDLDGNITGLHYVSTAVQNQIGVDPFDLNPNGVALAGPTGLAAGGLLVADGEQLFVRGYNNSGVLQSGSFSVNPPVANFEDLTYVFPLDEIWALKQEPLPALIARYTNTGTFVSTFPIAQSADPTTAGEAKGMAYFSPTNRNPARFDDQADGYVLVALDENDPKLQAFDLEGNLIASESLTTNGLPSGPSKLALASSCPNQLQIESLTGDPATGRLFLNNQGDGNVCNDLFVLTPYCRADIDRLDGVDLADFFAFLNGFDASDAEVADINGDGIVDLTDFFTFLNAFDASC